VHGDRTGDSSGDRCCSRAQIRSLLTGAKQALLGVGSTTVAVVVNFVLVLVIGFMWLVSSAGVKRFVIDLLPERHRVEAGSVMDEVAGRGRGITALSIRTLELILHDLVEGWVRIIPCAPDPRIHPA
jgi:predicted PurR-regulated permease PerM